MADTKTRHPGRRPAADPAVVEHHADLIRAVLAEETAHDKERQKILDRKAKAIDAAMKAGVQTNYIAEELLDVSRQAVYKLVAERIDHKKPKPKSNGTKLKPAPKRASAPTKAGTSVPKPRVGRPRIQSPRKKGA
jgi:hypothetical protein